MPQTEEAVAPTQSPSAERAQHLELPVQWPDPADASHASVASAAVYVPLALQS